MSYLLIDLEKPILPLQDISPQAGAVLLFTKRKRNRKLAKQFAKTHRATKVVHTPSGEKLSDVLANELKKILKKEPTAGVIVASRRKKVARLLDKLLNRYPDAELVLMDKLLPKTPDLNIPACSCHAHSSSESEMPQPIEIKMEKKVVAALTYEPKLLEQPVSVPLLESPSSHPSSAVEQALNCLKKNRPKKKAALLQVLMTSLQLDESAVIQLIDELVQSGALQIDVAQNVKYR